MLKDLRVQHGGGALLPRDVAAAAGGRPVEVLPGRRRAAGQGP